jgi:hypothetical protein
MDTHNKILLQSFRIMNAHVYASIALDGTYQTHKIARMITNLPSACLLTHSALCLLPDTLCLMPAC